MSTVTPDDIPTTVTRLVYTAPKVASYRPSGELSQNQAAEFLAHFWPEVEQHIREQIAREIEQAAEASANSTVDRPRYERGGFLNDWQWAAQIARGAEVAW